METFAERLRIARKEAGLTQRDLADIAGLKSHIYVSKLEKEPKKGEKEALPRTDLLISIADVLGVSLDWLLLGENTKKSSPKTVQAFRELNDLPEKSREAICELIISLKKPKERK